MMLLSCFLVDGYRYVYCLMEARQKDGIFCQFRSCDVCMHVYLFSSPAMDGLIYNYFSLVKMPVGNIPKALLTTLLNTETDKFNYRSLKYTPRKILP